jgi:hypothetical protein
MHGSTTGRPGTEPTRSTALATRRTQPPGPGAPFLPGAAPAQRRPGEPVCDRERRSWPGMGAYATRSARLPYLHQHSHPHHTIVDSFFHAALRGSRRHAQAGPAAAAEYSWPCPRYLNRVPNRLICAPSRPQPTLRPDAPNRRRDPAGGGARQPITYCDSSRSAWQACPCQAMAGWAQLGFRSLRAL